MIHWTGIATVVLMVLAGLAGVVTMGREGSLNGTA